MYFIGIDPGLQGGIAVLDDLSIATAKMPDSVSDIAAYLKTFPVTDTHVLIELQGARPAYARKHNNETNQDEVIILRGVNATWTFAQHYGELRGILITLGLDFATIRPQDWQAAIGMKKLKGEQVTAWKNRLKEKAQELFPSLKITKATADAILIAEVCRRLNQSLRKVQPALWDDF